MAARPPVVLLAAALGSVVMACGSGPTERAANARSTQPTQSSEVVSDPPAESATDPPPDSATTAPRPTPPAAPPTTRSDGAGPTTAAVETTAAPPPPTGPPIITRPADIGVVAPSDVAAPVRVEIPSLAVDGLVLAVGVNAENQLDVPPDAQTLVWYRHGPSPGSAGSAVIAGHLNWQGVTGIFSNLAATPVGEIVSVSYDDGSRRDFAVSTVELVPKPAVSVNGTFARNGDSALRLVTCGGVFDESVSSYESNVVVTALPV